MNFVDLGLSERTALSLLPLGIEKPTEIQGKAIPAIFRGSDIMASAETGSGKTAAYALPIIQELARQNNKGKKTVRVLIMVPTRELAIQVNEQFKRFSQNSGLRTACIYGGTRFERQTRNLERGVDIIVATPGRLFDHISRGNADLTDVDMLVLDEADRMLDMGFMPQVRQIVKRMPNRRQTLMFSATISKGIESAAEKFLNKPVTIRVNTKRVEPKNLVQKVFQLAESEKEELLMKLLKEQPDVNSVLVFARTRAKATRIRKKLCAADVPAEEIHSNISQNKREKTLSRYRKGEFSVLVATDVAARGLDVPEISHVVNYDLPDQAEDYVHRIGRTGRAGRSGIAYSFVCSNQRHIIRRIEKIIGRELIPGGDSSKSKSKSKPKQNAQPKKQQSNGKARPTKLGSNNSSKPDATKSKTRRSKNKSNVTKSKTGRSENKFDATKSKTRRSENKFDDTKPKSRRSENKYDATKSKTRRSENKFNATKSKTWPAENKYDATKSKTRRSKSKSNAIKSKPWLTENKYDATSSKTRRSKSKSNATRSKPWLTEDATSSKSRRSENKFESTKSKTRRSKNKSNVTKSKTRHSENKFDASRSKTRRSKPKSHQSHTKLDTKRATENLPRAKSSRSKKRRRRRVREYCSELKAR